MADAKTKALYNAARRYCIDRLEAQEAYRLSLLREHATTRVERLRFEMALKGCQATALNDLTQLMDLLSDEAEASLLDAILTEIERRLPDHFRSVVEARDYLMGVGQQATLMQRQISMRQGEVTVEERQPEWSEAERADLERSRAAYLAYVADLTVDQAAQAKPAPYRHVMSTSKRRRIGKKLAQHWEVDPLWHCWHPLWTDHLPLNVIALQDFYFYKEVGIKNLQDILLHHGITRVWELNEQRLDPEYELDVRLCRFAGVETYWSSRELDWLVYISHESSIAFAGAWLIEAVKQVWPNWEQRIYVDWGYEQSFD